jgi:hypothetical protein
MVPSQRRVLLGVVFLVAIVLVFVGLQPPIRL